MAFSVTGKARGLPAYLTVFLALSLGIFLTLFTVLLAAVRAGADRLKAQIAVTAAADSVLAEYDRDLLAAYDLLYLDTGYGGEPSEDRVCQRFAWYLEENLQGPSSFGSLSLSEGRLTGTRYAADRAGESVRRQIYACMAADPAGRAVSDILVLVDRWEGISLPGEDYAALEKENRSALEDAYRKGRERREALAGEEREEEGEGGADPLPAFMDFQKGPLLSQILGEGGEIPAGALRTGTPLSGRSRIRGTGLSLDDHAYPEADPALMDLYLSERFSSYTKRFVPGEGIPVPAGALTCQLEYILYGKQTDRENLEEAAEGLMLIRTGINTALLLTDGKSRAEAKAAALLVTALLMIPEAADIFQTAFLLAWAYMESLSDLRILLDGGKIPLAKTREDFRTGLSSVFHPEAGGGGGSAGGEDGLSYDQYLRILLYLEPEGKKTLRAMDVMEDVITRLPGRSAFRMDGCLDALSLTASLEGGAGPLTLTRKTGYN